MGSGGCRLSKSLNSSRRVDRSKAVLMNWKRSSFCLKTAWKSCWKSTARHVDFLGCSQRRSIWTRRLSGSHTAQATSRHCRNYWQMRSRSTVRRKNEKGRPPSFPSASEVCRWGIGCTSIPVNDFYLFQKGWQNNKSRFSLSEKRDSFHHDPRTSNAQHSTWAVCGNMSTGWTVSNV